MATHCDPDPVQKLTDINLEDILISLGWSQARFGRKLLEWPFRGLARRFACQVLEYDRCVASLGLQAGSHQFLRSLLKDLVIEGQASIPAAGPVLFLANHPGMTDTASLFASIPRPDLKIVAADRPFLRALPAIGSHLVFVPEETGDRMNVVRQVVSTLRQGGAVLTFPAGQIEPDPVNFPGAVTSLQDWGSSIGVFARLVPSATIVPVIVSGVIARRAARHPITFLRRKPKDRERLGATLQIASSLVWPELWPEIWNVRVRVQFGGPIPAASLAELHDPELITCAVVDRVRLFMEECVQMPDGRNCAAA